MYNIRDFKVVSGVADTLLFFSSDYQKAVTEAINEVMKSLQYNENMKLITGLSSIEIIEPAGTRHFQMLRQYNSAQDKNYY